MKSKKPTPLDFEPGKPLIICYIIASLNAVTLVGTILFVSWVVGRIIDALHTLVFSLALTAAPAPLPRDFSMLEDAIRKVEFQSSLQDAEPTSDSTALYAIDRDIWRNRSKSMSGR